MDAWKSLNLMLLKINYPKDYNLQRKVCAIPIRLSPRGSWENRGWSSTVEAILTYDHRGSSIQELGC